MLARYSKISGAVAIVATALGSTAVLAVEPAAIRLGPLFVAPTLSVETSHTDNLFRSANDPKSTLVLTTLPRVETWLQNGNNTYLLGYQLEDFRYSSSHDDDFTDQQVDGKIHHEFTARHAVNGYARYYDGHEERGTGLSEGDIANLIDEPITLDRLGYGGDYTFGANASRGRLNLAYDFEDLEYTNFRDITRFRNREQDRLGGTFFWKLAPRTDLLAEVRYYDNAYDEVSTTDAAGSRDSEEWNYYLGAEWDATARTSGSVRLGWYERDYESNARDASNGFSWEVSVDYALRSYSIFNLATRRFSQETNGLGDAIDAEEYEASWQHDWSGLSSTYLRVLYGNDDYTGITREDDRWSAEARYQRRVRRWFDLGCGYRYEERDSEAASLDYDRNVFFVEAQFSL